MSLRLGILASHPIQYQAPLFRELAQRVDLEVFFAHKQTAAGQASAGFGAAFEWDVDLLSGYTHRFLHNIAKDPDVSRFSGCDSPEISKSIRDGKFDGFLVMGWYLKSYCQAIIACRRAHVPVMVRGDSRLGTQRTKLKTVFKKLAYPILLRQFDACLYVGQDNRGYLEHYGVPDQRLFFSPHCVDTEWFGSRSSGLSKADARIGIGVAGKEYVLLFVGKLLERKRPVDLVDAASLLIRRGLNVRVVFAGDGPLRVALETVARSLNVPVTMLGFQNQTELPLVYRASDIMVLPSDGSETWGLVVNESLACGTPVAVSDEVGCARDLVEGLATGRVYPGGNVRALADALQSLLRAPGEPSAITEVSRRYSVSSAADGVVKALRFMSGRNGIP